MRTSSTWSTGRQPPNHGKMGGCKSEIYPSKILLWALSCSGTSSQENPRGVKLPSGKNTSQTGASDALITLLQPEKDLQLFPSSLKPSPSS